VANSHLSSLTIGDVFRNGDSLMLNWLLEVLEDGHAEISSAYWLGRVELPCKAQLPGISSGPVSTYHLP
jgi:hypothetical protein